MRKLALLPVLVLLASYVSAGETTRFYINDEMKRDIVTFTSKAPLETVIGKTADITGYVELDLENLSGTAAARFDVDLTSLETGIGLRDKHMRQQYLETDKYPKAVFELTGIKSASQPFLKNGQPIELLLEGDFTVHGISKKVEVSATATYIRGNDETKARLPGDLLHIVGTFDVYLSEHDIKRPKFVILKLDDRQKIDLDFFASTASPPPTTADLGDK